MFDDSFFNKVYILAERGRTDEALKMLDSVPKNHSEYPRALFYKSVILGADGDEEESQKLFNQAINKEFKRQSSMDNYDLAFNFAMGAYEAGDFEEAVEFFDDCLNIRQDDCDALRFKALSLFGLENYDDAIETIDKAIAIEDDNADLWTDKACILESMGDVGHSKKCFDKARKLDANNNYLLISLHVFYFRQEKYGEALKYLNRAIELYPDNPENYVEKAKFYFNLDDFDNANKYFDIAEEMDPDNLELLIPRAMFFLTLEEYEKSIEYVDKCLEIDDTLDFLLEIKLSAISKLDDEKLFDDTLNEIYQTNPEFIEAILNDGAPSIYDDGENRVYDMRDSEYSIFNDSNGYVLEEDIVYGKDYPSESMNFNIFNALVEFRQESDINEVFYNIDIMGTYSEDMLAEVLLDGEFIAPIDCENLDIKKEVSKKSPSELSALLKKHGIIASGKKKKLVKLAVKHLPLSEFTSNFTLTSEGEKFLKDYEWFGAYESYLLLFELSDISKYIDEHEGRDADLIQDYLCEHVRLALKKEDYDYLAESYISKSGIYLFDENYGDCLKESLKTFILLLNPIFSYELSIVINLLFKNEVVGYIPKSLKHLDDVDLKALFDELWDEKASKKDFCTKEVGFEYLKRLLDGEDEDHLSSEYRIKYLGMED